MDGPVFLDAPHGAAPILAAALGPKSDLGLWVTVDAERPLALWARDIACLSHLTEIADVAIASDTRDSLEVMRELWTGDAITRESSTYRLDHAIVLPVPSRAIELWWFDGERLRSLDDVELAQSSLETIDGAIVERFR
jgi:hypothetical protein